MGPSCRFFRVVPKFVHPALGRNAPSGPRPTKGYDALDLLSCGGAICASQLWSASDHDANGGDLYPVSLTKRPDKSVRPTRNLDLC